MRTLVLRQFAELGVVRIALVAASIACPLSATAATFQDVPVTDPQFAEIEAMYTAGITAGCATSPQRLYCPDDVVTRTQMGLFLLRAIHNGLGYTAPPGPTVSPFSDVSPSTAFYNEIIQASVSGALDTDRIIASCDTNMFCPTATVTRSTMAQMLLRAKHGPAYFPPAINNSWNTATSSFSDVASDPNVAWINQLAREGVTLGCTSTTYCPTTAVSRRSMAMFISRAFKLLAPSASGCAITATLSGSGLISESSVPWTGCGTSGTGLQNALLRIGSITAGTLQLSGTAGVLIGPTLIIPSNATLTGDVANGTYGTRLVGDARDASCSSGGPYRHSNCPIFTSYGTVKVGISRIDIDGQTAGRALGSAINLTATDQATLSYVRINGARKFGVTIDGGRSVLLDHLSVLMKKNGAGDEFGAGVWMQYLSNSQLSNSAISAPEYYVYGPPTPPTYDDTMDLVASYGGYNNMINANTLSYGNTAAVYAAQGEERLTVWNNQVSYFGQHGLDLDDCSRFSVLTNTVASVNLAALSLARCNGGLVRYNTLSGAWNQNVGTTVGTVMIYRGSSSNQLLDNYITATGGYSNYAVMFGYPPDGTSFPLTVGNTVTGNSLWTGSSGHIGGYGSNLSGNTISPNYLY